MVMSRYLPLEEALGCVPLREKEHVVSDARWVGFAWLVTVQSEAWLRTGAPEDLLAGGAYLVLNDRTLSGISGRQAWSLSVVEWANEHGYERDVAPWVREAAHRENQLRSIPSLEDDPQALRDLWVHPSFSATPRPVVAIGFEFAGRTAAPSRDEAGFFDALAQLFVESKSRELSETPVSCRQCRFSRGPVEVEHRLGSIPADRLLVVPARDRSYVTPGLVLHFIDAHGYRPPEAFVDAVTHFIGLSMVQRVRALREALGGSRP